MGIQLTRELKKKKSKTNLMNSKTQEGLLIEQTENKNYNEIK
jgi:hypothetical protein